MRRVLTYTAVCLLLFIIGADSWSDGWGATKKPWEVDRARWGFQAATAEAWSPSDIVATTLYWWRADQGVTYGSAAPACTSWTDIVAGKVAYAAAAANEPAWYTGVDGINGQPVIQGNGADDYLKTSGLATLDQPFTIWVVCTIPTDNANHRHLLGFGNVNYYLNHAMSVGGPGTLYLRLGVPQAAGIVPAPGSVQFYLIKTYAAAEDSLWANGVRKMDADAGTISIANFTIATDWLVTNFLSDSKIAEIGIASGTISAADILLLDAYIQTRYGLAAW